MILFTINPPTIDTEENKLKHPTRTLIASVNLYGQVFIEGRCLLTSAEAIALAEKLVSAVAMYPDEAYEKNG